MDYQTISDDIEKTILQLDKITDVKNLQGQTIFNITRDLKTLRNSIDKPTILHSLKIESQLWSAKIQLTTAADRINRALQAAQYRSIHYRVFSSLRRI